MLSILALTTALALAGDIPKADAKASPAERGLFVLNQLAGNWVARELGKDSPARFESIARGKSILQQSGFTAVYYLDFDTVMATVFPDDGYQPRFRSPGLTKDGKLEFILVDATNLKPGAESFTGFTIQFIDENRMVQRWRWTESGKEQTLEIAFTKTK